MEKGRRLLGKVGGGSILLTKGRAILFILGSLLVSRGGEGVLLERNAGRVLLSIMLHVKGNIRISTASQPARRNFPSV